MCEIMDDIMDEIREIARVEGREEGRIYNLIIIIKSKIAKAKPLEIIADELECKLEEIRELYEIIIGCGQDSSVEDIMNMIICK